MTSDYAAFVSKLGREDKPRVHCAQCGKMKTILPCKLKQERHFCDRNCKGRWWSENSHGEANPKFKGKVTVSCAQCGALKHVLPSHAHRPRQNNFFCKKECHNKWTSDHVRGTAHPLAKGREIPCSHCGKVNYVKPQHLKYKNHFCNSGCKGAWQSTNLRGTAHPRYKRVQRTCSYCGTVKERGKPKPGQEKFFCNRKCEARWRSTYLIGPAHPRYSKVEAVCAQCGVAQQVWPSHLRRKERHFCGLRCMGLWQSAHRVGPAVWNHTNGYSGKNRTAGQTVMWKLRCRIRSGMLRSLRVGKDGSWARLVPYTLEQLRKRLARTMPSGYTWDDFMAGRLHIDHIIPVSAFHFTTPQCHDFKRCWALSNLQLLPAAANISKHARLKRPFQPSLL